MKVDEDKIEELVLAVLYLTLHDERRAWKTINYATIDELVEKDLLFPINRRAKSVVFSDEGLKRAQASFEKLCAAE